MLVTIGLFNRAARNDSSRRLILAADIDGVAEFIQLSKVKGGDCIRFQRILDQLLFLHPSLTLLFGLLPRFQLSLPFCPRVLVSCQSTTLPASRLSSRVLVTPAVFPGECWAPTRLAVSVATNGTSGQPDTWVANESAA